MQIENVRTLAEIFSAHGLTLLEVDEQRIRMEKGCSTVSPVQSSAVAVAMPATATSDATIDFNHLVEVKSPMVGVFYSSPSPDAEMFVSIGSKIKKGDVLCIIEAMKLMNEITAEQDGEVVDICVNNGDIVEFGQVLFKII